MINGLCAELLSTAVTTADLPLVTSPVTSRTTSAMPTTMTGSTYSILLSASFIDNSTPNVMLM